MRFLTILFFNLLLLTLNPKVIINGNIEENKIYLTFDDGYPNKNCLAILDILKENDIKATFFIEGDFMENNTLAVKRIQSEQILANHTYSHTDITKMSNKKLIEDIKKLEDIAYKITGYEITKYFRPPMGFINQEKLKVITSLGYKVFNWNVTSYDYNRYNDLGVDYVVNKILKETSNGSIILMHTLTDSNVKALKIIIKELKNKGYIFSSLEEL